MSISQNGLKTTKSLTLGKFCISPSNHLGAKLIENKQTNKKTYSFHSFKILEMQRRGCGPVLSDIYIFKFILK